MENYELELAKKAHEALCELIGYGEGENVVAIFRKTIAGIVDNPPTPEELDDKVEILTKNQLNEILAGRGTPAGTALSQFNSTAGQNVSTSEYEKQGVETMKYITKRTDGRWQGRKTLDGKRYYVYGRTQRECYLKLLALRKPPVKKKKKIISLAKYSKLFIETYKKPKVKENTYGGYLNIVNKYLQIEKPIDEFKTVDLQEILNKMPPTRIREDTYTAIKQIFRKAYETDLIKKDVSLFLEKGKIIRGSRDALPISEQKLIWNNLPDDVFGNRIRFFLLTGVRPSELKTVTKEKLNENYVFIDGTKNKYAKRWVRISPAFYQILTEQSDDFFSYKTESLTQRFQRFCKKLNLPGYDLYKLRHTYATNLYILGVPDKERQIYLGHSSTSLLTNDVYTTYSPDVKKSDILAIYKGLLPDFNKEN